MVTAVGGGCPLWEVAGASEREVAGPSIIENFLEGWSDGSAVKST